MEAGWVLWLVWTLWKRENFLAHVGNWALILWISGLQPSYCTNWAILINYSVLMAWELERNQHMEQTSGCTEAMKFTLCFALNVESFCLNSINWFSISHLLDFEICNYISSFWNLLLIYGRYKITIMQVFRFSQWCSWVFFLQGYDAVSMGNCFLNFWDVIANHLLHHPYIFINPLFSVILLGPCNPQRWDRCVVSKCQQLISRWCSIISHRDRNLTKLQSVKKSTEVWPCQ